MLTVWMESKISRNIRFSQQAADTWNLMASKTSHGSTTSLEHRINTNLRPELLHQFFWYLWGLVSFEPWPSEQPEFRRKGTGGKTGTEAPCHTKDPCNHFFDNTSYKTPLEQEGNRKISCWCICWKSCMSQWKFKLLSQKEYLHIYKFSVIIISNLFFSQINF